MTYGEAFIRRSSNPSGSSFTSAALDEEGNVLFEVLNTVTFAEQSGKVKQISLARVINRTAKAVPYLAGMGEGWSQSLDRLGELLAKPKFSLRCPARSWQQIANRLEINARMEGTSYVIPS